MNPTTPRGALSPNLAEQLDRLSDRGRRDRILSQLGINPAPQEHEIDGQLALFDVDGKAL